MGIGVGSPRNRDELLIDLTTLPTSSYIPLTYSVLFPLFGSMCVNHPKLRCRHVVTSTTRPRNSWIWRTGAKPGNLRKGVKKFSLQNDCMYNVV